MTRWGAYVSQRLDEMGRGEGDYTGLRRPSAATVAHARKVAAETFRDDTPAPSVVPGADGGIYFVWHKNGYDAEICVTETEADIWARQRATGDEWASPLPDHDQMCIPHVLDALERERR
jgi:hypothetical protein